MRKSHRILSALMTVFILMNGITVFAAGNTKMGPMDRVFTAPSNLNLNTPPENVFKLEGSDKEFILLDTFDDEKSTFFVMAKDAYGKKPFDPDGTQKYDPEDKNNLAYWLNNDFITKGNGPANIFPAEMAKYINKEQQWLTEGGFSGGNCPDDYTVTAGMGLMSQTEWLKYIDKFGVRDNVPVQGWWLRTGRGLNGDKNMVLCTMLSSDRTGQTFGQDSKNATEYSVRPVFYLTKDFFKKVKIDTKALGTNVSKVLAQKYGYKDFQGEGTLDYTDDEVRRLGIKISNDVLVEDFEDEKMNVTGNVSREDQGVFGKKCGKLIGGEMVWNITQPVQAVSIVFNYKTDRIDTVNIKLVDINNKEYPLKGKLKTDQQWNEFEIATQCVEALKEVRLEIPSKGTLYLDNLKIRLPEDIADNGGFAKGKWAITNGAFDMVDKDVLKVDGSEKKQYLMTSFAPKSNETYEISLRVKCKNISKPNGVRLKSISLNSKGEATKSWSNVLVFGGNSDFKDYKANLTGRTPDTSFLIYVLELDEDVKGTLYIDQFNIDKVTEKVEITHPWAPFYIVNPNNDGFYVKAGCDAAIPKYYTVEYTLSYIADGATVKGKPYKFEVLPGTEKLEKVPMENLHKGNAVIEITVKSGDNIVKNLSTEISISAEYTEQLTDKSIDSIQDGICIYPDLIYNSKGEILNAMQKAGVKYIRMDLTWQTFETGSKGNFNYARLDFIMGEIDKRGMHVLGILAYNNPLYSGAASHRTGIRNPVELEGFLNYTKKIVERYPQIKQLEIWNEPNGGGLWAPLPSVYEYVSLVKAVSVAIREINPEVLIIAGAIDTSKKGPNFAEDMFKLGIYPYVDALSTHPYYHTARNDAAFVNTLKKYTDTVERHGGWKDVIFSEAGWPVFEDKDLEDVSAQEVIKIIVNSDAYGAENLAIYNVKDEAETFGFLRGDNTARPVLAAVNTNHAKLQGAQYITTIKGWDNVLAYLYVKDGKPVVAAWSPNGEATVDIPEENVQVDDMYGNTIYKGSSFTLNASPAYIHNLSDGWLRERISEAVLSGYTEFLQSHGNGIEEGIRKDIEKLSEQAKDISSMDGKEVMELIDLHYAVGSKILSSYTDKAFSAEMTLMMEKFHNIGIEISNIYADSVKEADKKPVVLSTEKIKALEIYKNTNAIKDSHDVLPFTNELMRHVKRFNRMAEALSSLDLNHDGKMGYVNAWDLLACKLTEWAQITIKTEQVQNVGVYFNINPQAIETFQGETANTKVRVYNQCDTAKSGKLEIVDDTGEVVGTYNDIAIERKSQKDVNVGFAVKKAQQSGVFAYGLRYVTGNGTYYQDLPVTLKSKVVVNLMHQESVVSEVKQIKLKLENVTTKTMNTSVEVIPPEGWSLDTTSKSVVLDQNKAKEVAFAVTKKAQKAFNHYVFNVTIKDEEGKEINKLQMPLDFSVVVKAGKEINTADFDGDISAWSSAYPTYMGYPSDVNSKEAWKNSNTAARYYSMWDDNYFYMLVDVYEQFQNQINHEGSIWNADSIQVAFDTLGTKAAAYDADDYEYGFALTGKGEEAYAWKVGGQQGIGVKDAKWTRVIRDEENKNTRYLVRIPRADLAPMDMNTGKKFGFNLAINNSNLLGSRESWLEITGGITSSKNTGLYRSWKLVDTQIPTQNGMEEINKIFNTKLGVLKNK